jgi:hypothetical protein
MRSAGTIAQEMMVCRALEIESRFGTLGINYYVFETNYDKLKQLLAKTQTPDQIWRSGEVNAIMYELIRLLHNFLASAKMLVEHTRHVMRDWYSRSVRHRSLRKPLDFYAMLSAFRFSRVR